MLLEIASLRASDSGFDPRNRALHPARQSGYSGICRGVVAREVAECAARRHWRSDEKHVARRDIGNVVDSEIASAGLSSFARVEDVFHDVLVRRVPRRALRKRWGHIRGDAVGAFGRSA